MPSEPDHRIELPEPWYYTDVDLSQQLGIEISADHPLKNEHVRTIARRRDRDDVLFQLTHNRYALVHLTWQQYPHSDNRWPTTKIFTDWEEVYNNVILPDAAEFSTWP